MSTNISFTDKLEILMRSHTPLVVINSHEESRVVSYFKTAAKNLGRPAHLWSVTQGYKPEISPRQKVAHNLPAELEALVQIWECKQSSTFLLKDFNPYLQDSRVVRLLRDIGSGMKEALSTTFLLSPRTTVPVELSRSVFYLDIPLQTAAEIQQQMIGIIDSMQGKLKGLNLSPLELLEIARLAVGMTEGEIETACAISLVEYRTIDSDFIRGFRQDLVARKIIDEEDSQPSPGRFRATLHGDKNLGHEGKANPETR